MSVLRDQDSVESLAKRLPGVRRAVLVGNGGIALEVAFAFSGLEVCYSYMFSLFGFSFCLLFSSFAGQSLGPISPWVCLYSCSLLPRDSIEQCCTAQAVLVLLSS